MPMKKRRHLVEPTDEEDAAINEGIAKDPDTREVTPEDFARARRFEDLEPELRDAINRARGRPAKPQSAHKVRVNMTLDREVQDALKRKAGELDSGGASTFVNALLRRELKLDA